MPRRHPARCQATTKDGRPCPANATARSGWSRCPFHEEHIAEAIKEQWRAKGRAVIARQMTVPNAPAPALSSPQHVTAFIEETAGRVLRGEITGSTAVALTSLATWR